MKRFLYFLGLLFFFSAGAASVLLVDLARQRLTDDLSQAEQPQVGAAPEAVEPRVVPLIPEDEIWDAPAAADAAPETGQPAATESFAEAVALAAPAVVNVFTSRVVQRQEVPSPFFNNPFFDDFFSQIPQPRERVQRSLGSGVILDASGHIITNYHVVAEADDILIALNDGRETKAEVVGVDPETDLALLQIDLLDLPVIRFGKVDDINVGDLVLAIGNPYGVGQTVTQGIISATGRSDIGITTFENFLQTDAAINPGNSGGALINVRGELWGINTAIFSRTGSSHGVGFAIPVDLARRIVDQILSDGSVVRGWMGVSLRGLEEDDTFKIIVNGVYRGGPADLAGIQAGDELVTLDGRSFEDTATVVSYVAAIKPGEEMLVSVRRGESIIDLSLTTGTRPLRN